MKIKTKRKNVTIGVLSVLLLAVLVRAAIPDNLSFKVENSTDTVFTVDKLGHVNTTGNFKTDLDLYVDGSLICTDCIDDADLDFGSGAGQIDSDDIPEGTTNYYDDDGVDDDDPEAGDVDWTDLTDDGTFTDTKYCTYDSGNSRIDCDSDSSAGAGNTTEEVQDAAWDITGGTQTRITVTYEDGTNDVDFVVDDLGNTSAEIQAVAVGGEASGTVGSITLSNTALDDQYVDDDGDTMTGDLNFNGGDINLNSGSNPDNVTDVDSNSYFYFDGNGALVVHLES